jgi:hypothetical protein
MEGVSHGKVSRLHDSGKEGGIDSGQSGCADRSNSRIRGLSWGIRMIRPRPETTARSELVSRDLEVL